MKLSHAAFDPFSAALPLLAVPVPEGAGPAGDGAQEAGARLAALLDRADAACSGAVSRLLEEGDFRGKDGDEALLYGGGMGGGGDAPARLLLLGVGRSEELDAEALRRFAGRAVRAAERLRVSEVSAWAPPLDGDAALAAQAVAEGAALAAWRFDELKSEGEDPPFVVTEANVFGDGPEEDLAEGVRVGSILARGANLARTLQARPGNVATPSHLADVAREVGEAVGLEVTVFDEARLRDEGMHAILAVSRGSEEEARLIVMEHRGGADGEPPLVLVGKGLTFDAGGISLKPPAGMEEMKFDMSGGAAVIGAMQAVAELGVKANVVGLVPSSENLPSGTAVKPGDIIQTLAGKSVEVINTDAEGRLILADALAYGARMKPAAMVDCATLTGAVIICLGHHAQGLMGNDDGLVEEIRAAGERAGERCWPLPLWKEYRKQLDSEYADLLNVGGRPAGTITAGCFLQEFVGDTPWAHLDIAGTAYGDKPLPYQRKGGYGLPARTLVEWVRSRAG